MNMRKCADTKMRRQRKNNEDFSDEDLTVDEQEDIDSGKEQNLKRENTQNEQIKRWGR